MDEVSGSKMVNASVSKVDAQGVKSSSLGVDSGRDNGVVSHGVESG